MRSTRLACLAIAATLVVALTACSDEDAGGRTESGGDATASGTTNGGSEAATIEVVSQEGEVSPLGETVEVGTGEEITLRVSSDIEDEYHVHSEPEQELDVKAADGQTFTFSIDTPGVYDLESHELGVVIVKLQVS